MSAFPAEKSLIDTGFSHDAPAPDGTWCAQGTGKLTTNRLRCVALISSPLGGRNGGFCPPSPDGQGSVSKVTALNE